MNFVLSYLLSDLQWYRAREEWKWCPRNYKRKRRICQSKHPKKAWSQKRVRTRISTLDNKTSINFFYVVDVWKNKTINIPWSSSSDFFSNLILFSSSPDYCYLLIVSLLLSYRNNNAATERIRKWEGAVLVVKEIGNKPMMEACKK